MDDAEVIRITTVLNATHAKLIHCDDLSLASAPELDLYRLAMSRYGNGYALALLEDAGMLADAANKCLILNTNSIAELLQCRDLATTDDRNLSAMLFALHETFHVVQGIPDHGDIRRIKQLGGKWLISFLDLRSTSHAANLLADLLALNGRGQPSASMRDQAFKRLWIDIGHASLHAFPIHNNPAKCQRFVGHLMTSVLLLNPALWPSWSTRHVLWPVWSANEDEVLILSSNMNVLVPPTTVPRVTLRGAIECLCSGDTAGALPQVHTLLDCLRPSATMMGP